MSVLAGIQRVLAKERLRLPQGFGRTFAFAHFRPPAATRAATRRKRGLIRAPSASLTTPPLDSGSRAKARDPESTAHNHFFHLKNMYGRIAASTIATSVIG